MGGFITMIYILLSLIVMVVQGILDMADWWVLGSNFVLATMLVGAVSWTLNAQGLFNFTHPDIVSKAIAALAGTMNLGAICLAEEMPWWQFDLLMAGGTALLLIGSLCWQSKNIPVPTLLLGLLVGLLTPVYLPTLLWLVTVLTILMHCYCLSARNLACVGSGLLSGIWVVYCLTFWLDGSQAADGYLLSFANGWDTALSYELPDVTYDGATGWLFPLAVLVLSLTHTAIGFFMGNYNSLRMRSNVTVHSSISLLCLVLMPTCWPLFLALAVVSAIFLLFLSMSDELARTTRRLSTLFTALILLVGIGEPITLMLIDFLSGITWPWENWHWPF